MISEYALYFACTDAVSTLLKESRFRARNGLCYARQNCKNGVRGVRRKTAPTGRTMRFTGVVAPQGAVTRSLIGAGGS